MYARMFCWKTNERTKKSTKLYMRLCVCFCLVYIWVYAICLWVSLGIGRNQLVFARFCNWKLTKIVRLRPLVAFTCTIFCCRRCRYYDWFMASIKHSCKTQHGGRIWSVPACLSACLPVCLYMYMCVCVYVWLCMTSSCLARSLASCGRM